MSNFSCENIYKEYTEFIDFFFKNRWTFKPNKNHHEIIEFFEKGKVCSKNVKSTEFLLLYNIARLRDNNDSFGFLTQFLNEYQDHQEYKKYLVNTLLKSLNIDINFTSQENTCQTNVNRGLIDSDMSIYCSEREFKENREFIDTIETLFLMYDEIYTMSNDHKYGKLLEYFGKN
jgi:hypothetical protein